MMNGVTRICSKSKQDKDGRRTHREKKRRKKSPWRARWAESVGLKLIIFIACAK